MQVKGYAKIRQPNVSKILLSNEIIDNASNLHENTLFINTKEIESYDVSYENFSQSKNRKVKNKLLTHNVFQQMEEFITNKQKSLHMKQLNNEQRAIVEISYTKKSKSL